MCRVRNKTWCIHRDLILMHISDLDSIWTQNWLDNFILKNNYIEDSETNFSYNFDYDFGSQMQLFDKLPFLVRTI